MAVVAARNDDVLRRPRSVVTLAIFFTMLGIAFCGFTALGIWQLQRLQWKLDLIDRVESRIHGTPVAIPPTIAWPDVSAARDEYTRVRVEGHFIPGHDTRVQALTELGAGFWVLSPFQLHDGSVVFINRGYVPSTFKQDLPPSSATSVTGLLRLSEPGGGFLRSNAPQQERWYSRDTAAIAGARGLAKVAPFFIDAEANRASPDWPRGGLTVTRFSNNHLGYAVTWFALALLCAWAAWLLAGSERKLRRGYPEA